MLHDLKNLNCPQPQPNSHSLLTTEATLHSQNNSNMICHTVKKRHFPFWLIWTIWTKSNLAKLMDLFCLSSFNVHDSGSSNSSLLFSVPTSEERRGLWLPVSGFCRLFPLVTIKSVETVIKVLQHILMPRLGPHPSRAGTPDHIATWRSTKLGEKTLSIAIKLCGVWWRLPSAPARVSDGAVCVNVYWLYPVMSLIHEVKDRVPAGGQPWQ